MAKSKQTEIAANKRETQKKTRRSAETTAVGAAVAAPEVEMSAPAPELETVAPLEVPAPPTRLAAVASVRDENNSPAAAPSAEKRKTTTPRRPFACPIDGCGKTYARNMILLIHLAKIHPEHIRPNAFADAFPNYGLQAHAAFSSPSRSVAEVAAEVAAEVEDQDEVEGEAMKEEATWVCDACLGKAAFNTREELKTHLWEAHRYGWTVIRRATGITQPLFGRGAFV